MSVRMRALDPLHISLIAVWPLKAKLGAMSWA